MLKSRRIPKKNRKCKTKKQKKSSKFFKAGEWLSDEDIYKALKQNEKCNEGLRVFFPQTIDFDKENLLGKCEFAGLCNFSFKKLKKDYTKVVAVLNTDTYEGEGIHWISLYMDLKKNKIYFFDSCGNGLPDELRKYLSKLKKQASKLDINLKIYVNKMKHQYGANECGMYSINFHDNMIKNTNYFSYLQKNRVSDLEMSKLRNKYFN